MRVYGLYGWAPFSHRELQKKLSSPQRKPQRKILSAAEAKLRQERKYKEANLSILMVPIWSNRVVFGYYLIPVYAAEASGAEMVAELNRAQLASGVTEKLKQHEERARGVRFRKEEQLLKAEEEAKRKMEGADARRKEHRRGIVRKANDANSKVEEVLFMNKLTVEDLKITLQMKLAEVDRRIQSGRARRQQLLAGISDRQRKRTRDKAAQMSERRLEAESAANRHTQARERREAMLHHPARVTAPATVTGKSKGGGTAVWIDSRHKGAMDAAAPATTASADKNNSRNTRNDGSGNARNVNDENDTNDEVDFPEGKPRPESSRTPRNVSVRGPAAAMYEDPPPTQAPSAALLLATTACPRRGRAQKKRARKVKDNLRQLCVEASTTGPTATAVAPWPRLEKAAGELAELALAKTQVVKSHAVAQAATPPADAPASRLAPAAAVLLAASTEQPSLSMPTSPVGLLSGVNSGDVITAVVAAGGTTMDENVGCPCKGRAAALIAEVNAEDGARSGDGGGGGSGSSSGADQLSARGEGGRLLRGRHRKTRRGKRAGGVINRRRGAKARSAAAAAAIAALGTQEMDSQSPVCSAVASGGVEDGGAGCEVKPGNGAGEEDTKGEVVAEGGYDIAEEREGGGGRGGDAESLAEAGAASLCTADTSTPPSPHASAECRPMRDTPTKKRKNRRAHTPQQHHTPATEEQGSIVTGKEEKGAAADSGTAGCAGGVTPWSEDDAMGIGSRGSPPGGAPVTRHQLRSSSQGMAAIEAAAWRSLRDLQAMCPAASAPFPSRAVSFTDVFSAPPSANGGGYSAVAGATTTANENMAQRLRSQAKSRGVLDSLVAICAPFPWTPVVPQLNAAAASEQEPDAAATAANPGVANACSTGLPPSSCSSSPSTPSTAGASTGAGRAPAASTLTASMAFPSPAGSTPTAPGGNGGSGGQDQGNRVKEETAASGEGAAASAAAGEGNGGGREAMTESALEVLLASLADEPGNRDHVLRIDGGAPLVDCLFRLLERATRHGDTTKRPGPRLPPFDAAVPPEDRTVMGVLSLNSTADTNTMAMESGDVGSRNKEYRRGLELPVNSKALCGREVGAKLEVEEALLTALAVVSLLVRHRSSDRSIWRIQEGLVQYLATKRLLSDLSVLIYQLHAFCATAALPTTGTRTREGPAETGIPTGKNHHDGNKRRSTSPTGGELLPPPLSLTTAADKHCSPRSRSQSPDSSRRLPARPLPVLVLRRKTTIAGSKPTRSLSPLPSRHPLLQVAGRVAELVTAVVSHSLVRAAGPATATCRAVEDLRRGALAAPPTAHSPPLARGPAAGGAGSPTPASGAVRAVGSLVSLAAAMVGTEKERRQRQPPSSGVAVLGAEKKDDDDDSRQRRDDAASPIEASSTAATGSLETEKEGAAIPLSDGLLCLSSAAVQAANLACVQDLEAVQASLSADGLQPEFLFLCDHLLADLTNRISAQDVAPPNSETTAPEGCLEGVLTLLGYFCLDNREHQEVLRRGGPFPAILSRLCDLPFRYFSEPRHRAVLLPTLTSICHANAGNIIAAEEELSSEFLADFLEENLEAHRSDEAAAAVAAAVGVHEEGGVRCIHATPPRESNGQRNGSNIDAAAAATTKGSQQTVASPSDWRTLSLRFPLELWDDAISFFRSAPRSDQETQT
ncbi:unnamed protein product [Ectocarpus sp. CCAP 1310/34]|nr:unnamed protein product [Ectocarpus sp. CCAP 1310/34]